MKSIHIIQLFNHLVSINLPIKNYININEFPKTSSAVKSKYILSMYLIACFNLQDAESVEAGDHPYGYSIN